MYGRVISERLAMIQHKHQKGEREHRLMFFDLLLPLPPINPTTKLRGHGMHGYNRRYHRGAVDGFTAHKQALS